MSPILRLLARQTLKTTSRKSQNFSILARARQLARSAEPHPFGRLPILGDSQAPDYTKMVRRVGDVAKFYFPFMAFFLAWPLVTEAVMDGKL